MRRSSLVCLLALLGGCALSIEVFTPSARAQKQPAAVKGDYQLRVIRVGKTFQAMRFKVSTGESWIMDGGKYAKVAEAAVPAGEYDIVLVTDDSDWMAFRIDRRSGTTWQLQARKWVKVKEPAQKE